MMTPFRIALRLRSASLFVPFILAASSGLLVAPRAAYTQSLTGRVIVHVTADSMPIAGAAVLAGTASGVTDQSGLARFTLPTGRRTFRVSPVGFRPESLAMFVGVGTTRVTVAVRHVAPSAPREAAAAPHEPVAAPHATAATLPVGRVAATRDGFRTADAPTSVDVRDRDAIAEQLDRSPGTISELLADIGGVRIQPLSAGSGGAGIRIRGMPGRYTKILIDGLPLLGATPEGPDVLQIPAIDLERVEVIKGITSALYGPTALSGVVNLVSAPPTSPSAAVVNGTTGEASDVSIWQTHTFTPQWSATLVAGRHYQNANDPDGDGWAEVGGYKRIVVRPRVYWSRSEQSSWFMTGGWTSENRRSGTFGDARLPDYHFYSADADTRRADAGTVGRIVLDTSAFLTIRASMTREWRTRWYGSDAEANRRNTILSDVALTKTRGEHVMVAGVAIERDQYSALDTREFSYRYTTPALFAEHTWTPDRRIAVTSGARLDLHSEFGDFVSPRVAIVVRPSETWHVRLSRAIGVYAPTPLTDETEAIGLSHFRPTVREAEHADGWSLDAGRVRGSLEVGGSAYRTVVNHPLVLRTASSSDETLELVNADQPSRTQGIDLSARYRMHSIRFTAAYSYIDAMRPEIGRIIGVDFEADTTMRRPAPLNPRHAIDFDVSHERANDRIIGLAVHFTGRQTLTDTLLTVSQPYVTVDARFEKHVGRTIVFLRAKNLTDVRQAQFAPVLRRASGHAGEWTNDVWAPLDGRVMNAGLRMTY
jgi:outer membrane receptor for ferrienterochelin and colicins